MYTRRDLGKLALTGLPLAALAAAEAPEGVRLGASTYSLRDLPHVPGHDNVDAVIQGLQFAGVTEIELSSADLEPAPPHMGPEPPPPSAYPPPMVPWTPEHIAAVKLSYRNSLRDWRLSDSASSMREYKTKFTNAGINVFAYRTDFDESFTDAEIDSVFEQAAAMGAGVLSTGVSLITARRLAPFTDKHHTLVALRTPETLAQTLTMSKNFRVSLDTGDFTALNLESVAYIQENHDRISHIQIKDRTRNGGGNEMLGQGDTPIREVLALVKAKKYAIPVFAEYEYIGLGTPRQELKRCMAYIRSALSA